MFPCIAHVHLLGFLIWLTVSNVLVLSASLISYFLAFVFQMVGFECCWWEVTPRNMHIQHIEISALTNTLVHYLLKHFPTTSWKRKNPLSMFPQIPWRYKCNLKDYHLLNILCIMGILWAYVFFVMSQQWRTVTSFYYRQMRHQ